MTEEDVIQAIHCLKSGKSDDANMFSEHFKYASPVIAGSLASFFTASLRHGYMPSQIRDCVLIPIPKSGKESSSRQTNCSSFYYLRYC